MKRGRTLLGASNSAAALVFGLIFASFTGCAPMIPVVAASAYVAAQTAAAHMPDSLERQAKD